ncbi:MULTISPECIES: ABC transporter permease [Paraburkholderia]|jgi:putative spermidine/putrescine transport system permease protein|uniref:ABC transporter permease n=1 Tax=Paraburkholderia TaxID=1822464 RepID=UPI0022520E99|nr:MULTISPECIES: ABC transporter permease [Paraburkholderia]MCX4158298.1 ABC transporter permease [Paraburkholderia aspalathi]MDN7167700.1 ABC transporter permease [Paraburkholderia sp. SECH2]MDQ6396188.1 ABC transporter permease [Paraburkholderia aspalathi]
MTTSIDVAMPAAATPGVVIDKQERRYVRLRNIIAFAVYAFILVPTLIVIPISFGGNGELTFPPRVWSLELYEQLFSSSSWVGPILQSIKVAGCTMVVSILIGVPASYGLVRFDFPGKRLVMLLLMSPILVPVIVISLGLYLYLSRLHLVGTTAGLVASHVAYVTPFMMMTVMAGVKKLDPALEFVTTIMGANRRTVFFKVVLPQLKPSIFAGALFAFLVSFDEVVIAWFLTSPTTTTLPVKMYSSIQWDISPVIAAVSALLTVLSLVFCCISVFLQPAAAESSN